MRVVAVSLFVACVVLSCSAQYSLPPSLTNLQYLANSNTASAAADLQNLYKSWSDSRQAAAATNTQQTSSYQQTGSQQTASAGSAGQVNFASMPGLEFVWNQVNRQPSYVAPTAAPAVGTRPTVAATVATDAPTKPAFSTASPAVAQSLAVNSGIVPPVTVTIPEQLQKILAQYKIDLSDLTPGLVVRLNGILAAQGAEISAEKVEHLVNALLNKNTNNYVFVTVDVNVAVGENKKDDHESKATSTTSKPKSERPDKPVAGSYEWEPMEPVPLIQPVVHKPCNETTSTATDSDAKHGEEHSEEHGSGMLPDGLQYATKPAPTDNAPKEDVKPEDVDNYMPEYNTRPIYTMQPKPSADDHVPQASQPTPAAPSRPVNTFPTMSQSTPAQPRTGPVTHDTRPTGTFSTTAPTSTQTAATASPNSGVSYQAATDGKSSSQRLFTMTTPVIATIAAVSAVVFIVIIVAVVVLAKKKQATRANRELLINPAYVALEPDCERGSVIANPTYQFVDRVTGEDSA